MDIKNLFKPTKNFILYVWTNLSSLPIEMETTWVWEMLNASKRRKWKKIIRNSINYYTKGNHTDKTSSHSWRAHNIINRKRNTQKPFTKKRGRVESDRIFQADLHLFMEFKLDDDIYLYLYNFCSLFTSVCCCFTSYNHNNLRYTRIELLSWKTLSFKYVLIFIWMSLWIIHEFSWRREKSTTNISLPSLVFTFSVEFHVPFIFEKFELVRQSSQDVVIEGLCWIIPSCLFIFTIFKLFF